VDTVANVYRPPGLSKSAFLDDFADFASLGSGTGEGLVICGDLNLPGSDAVNIDERLTSLLDIHGYQQHVTQSTRHDPRQLPMRRDNLLDLVITSTALASPLVSDVEVFDSYGASDTDLDVSNLSVMRHKLPPTRYTYRDIKKIDIADFENRLRSSDLFNDPAGSPDSYLAQFETTVTMVLYQVASLKVDHRPGGRRGARWLDPEAITTKQLSAFPSVTEDEVAKLIGSMPAKSSPLDFVPTSLLKACRYTFALQDSPICLSSMQYFRRSSRRRQ